MVENDKNYINYIQFLGINKGRFALISFNWKHEIKSQHPRFCHFKLFLRDLDLKLKLQIYRYNI